jgi:hypothetical protein
MPIVAPTTIVSGDLVTTVPPTHIDTARAWVNGGAVAADFDSLADVKLPRPSVHGYPRQEMDGETQFVKWHNPEPIVQFWVAGDPNRVRGSHQVIVGPTVAAGGKAPITHLAARFTLAKYSRFMVSMAFAVAVASESGTSSYNFPSLYVSMFYRYNGAGAITEVAGSRRALPGVYSGSQLPVRMMSGVLQPSVAGYVEVWAQITVAEATNFDPGSILVANRVDIINPNVLVEMFKDRTS